MEKKDSYQTRTIGAKPRPDMSSEPSEILRPPTAVETRQRITPSSSALAVPYGIESTTLPTISMMQASLSAEKVLRSRT